MPEEEIDENAIVVANPFSEILSPVPSTSNQNNNINDPSPSHYQVPTYSTIQRVPTPLRGFVSDEMENLIETKRKRTLLLLRLKEAPRASIEFTSPTTDDDMMLGQGEGQGLTSTSPMTVLSDYENLNNDEDDATRPLMDQPLATETVWPEILETASQPGEGVAVDISPSETSQNFNTLSLTSDLLDLSQEENSLVQQLSKG